MGDIGKRVNDHVETIVSWLISVQPKLRDEPSAFKAAVIRMGAQAALSPVGLASNVADEIVRLRADLTEAGEVIRDLQTFTFTVSADMDAELRARVRAWRDRVA